MKRKKFLIPIIIIFAFIMGTDSRTVSQTQKDVLDPDFFKRELQESVLEFIEDIGADPDTCYVPFRDLD